MAESLDRFGFSRSARYGVRGRDFWLLETGITQEQDGSFYMLFGRARLEGGGWSSWQGIAVGLRSQVRAVRARHKDEGLHFPEMENPITQFRIERVAPPGTVL